MEARGTTWRATGAALLGTIAFLAVPAASASASTRGDDIHASTRGDLNAAMTGEAFAHAKYRAYADQAGAEGMPEVRALFNRTAADELDEHFAEQARLTGLAGTDASNLRDTIRGEGYEATTMYKGFAKQAEAAGDTAAARRFNEIAADEAGHRARFERALRAIGGESGESAVPTDVTVKPEAIKAGLPQVSSPRTLENLRTALRGEALANAKYLLYAQQARREGRTALATLYQRTARVERAEHFAEQATLAGLVRDTRTNLREAIAGETDEGTRMYPGYARRAEAAGDGTAARVLSDTGRDELRHARAFSDALAGLEGRAAG
ncbi:rubrerythrin family protein [Microbispora sp. RL4-1S]|uniref:Rubrerythrin family protein n=1 Tax=Microbispora oryzae TaxID=2806554 RepID=A0A940WIK7_9ACTN|nr:ferritin family protein [Microbispora oryzae]MBP2703912.1 rubrerythrin family protein [Microbispora oryzae]